MEWQFLVALMVAIPLILLPAAFVWYMHAGGVLQALKGRWAKRTGPKRGQGTPSGRL